MISIQWTQPVEHICLDCDKTFTDHARNSKRCPVCRRIHVLKRALERHHERQKAKRAKTAK